MVRRWIRSLTGVLLQEAADGVGPVLGLLGGQPHEALGEALGKIVDPPQDRRKELELARTLRHQFPGGWTFWWTPLEEVGRAELDKAAL
jgi:hypothetical protein